MKKEELEELLAQLKEEYNSYKAKKLSLDMSRGKPGREQLDITQGMLTALEKPEDCISENGLDIRNYGVLDGIPEAKRIFADILETSPDNLIIGGNSSLNLMYDEITRMMLFGNCDSEKPWCRYDKIKFLCPVPGYDRHFSICESIGIEMINIPINADGPDMDMIEKYVSEDDTIKGIWCIPKYSNPDGVVYSDEVIRRFARLMPKAKDFRIMWDNAYIIHSLYGDAAKQLNLLEEAEKCGNANIVLEFMSTSKVSFPGSGVAVMAASKENIAHTKKYLTYQTIGYDKINMMRHVTFFKNAEGMKNHMKLHADIIRPKFEIVNDALTPLGDLGIASWTKPQGGYFICVKLMNGCATRVYNLALECGVKMTKAGAPFPYHKDPDDAYLRIAPTYPSNEDLTLASEILVLCIKIAAIEKLL